MRFPANRSPPRPWRRPSLPSWARDVPSVILALASMTVEHLVLEDHADEDLPALRIARTRRAPSRRSSRSRPRAPASPFSMSSSRDLDARACWAMAAMSRPARTFFSASAWTCVVDRLELLPAWSAGPCGAPAAAAPAPSCGTAARRATAGRRTGFSSFSFSTICSARAVSERSLTIFSSRVWMSARSSTSVWKLPTSFANSSSSAGGRAPSMSLTVTWNVAGLALEVFTRMLGRELGLGVDLVADLLADERRVELGQRLARAELELHPLPAAVLHSSPSTSSVKSIVTTSPFWAGRAGSGALSARVPLAQHLELLVDQPPRPRRRAARRARSPS